MTDSAIAVDSAPQQLLDLAEAHGVSTSYWDFHGNQATPSKATLTAVLAAMGVTAQTEEEIALALTDVELGEWRRTLPAFTVVREGTASTINVHVPDGSSLAVHAMLEDGRNWTLSQTDQWTPPREVDGVQTGRACFSIPENLPLGWHHLHVEYTTPSGQTCESTAQMIVTPQYLELPRQMGANGWGMMTQLYASRSRQSWGIGDAADLTEMVSFFGDRGADFLLINPLHAAEPSGHMTQSPYLPVTRRFVNPIYIRPELIPEVATLPGAQRSLVQWAHEEVQEDNLSSEEIDRDKAWRVKREALESIFAAGRTRSRQRAFERFRAEQGEGLERFALWSVLTEKYGELPQWPQTLRQCDSAYVANEARGLRERIDFYAWLQWVVDEQLANAQQEALDSGMALGVMYDLAVGVHPRGADVWSEPEDFAPGISVGAPPDMYNQQGQNWSQPPWNPVQLADSGYRPFRDMVRTVLRNAGAIRVDHILGLFRLWWIPEGMGANEGAYVRYDHEAMLGVLLLEAQRAGAIVIGEDLGTVEPWVREYLTSRGVLGTNVLWFEKQEDGWPLHPQDYRALALSTVNTHDLPPTAGYLADEHVFLREKLGLLTEPIEQVRAEARIERDRMLARMREHELLGEDATERETVEALHRYVVRTPSVLTGVALVDGVGQRSAQNQPGTDREYPNWCVPLLNGSGEPVLVDDMPGNVRLNSLIDAVNAEISRQSV